MNFSANHSVPRAWRGAGVLGRAAAIALALAALSVDVHAQDATVRDSTRAGRSADTAVAAPVAAGTDTTIAWKSVASADTIVTYTAKDSIVYALDDKLMHLFGGSAITYGSLGITAERITLNWDQSTIAARGIPDTAAGRAGRMTGTPVFREGSEKYAGQEMSYNFKSKQGVITQGETTIDNGFYRGERIKRKSEDTYFISSGEYTTCDMPEHKHYYFGSPKMKVQPNDVIVAEPIVLYIEDIPLFALPFAIIPSKSGRSSGVIIPSFGDDFNRGRYFKGGGYYLAASDYWDAKLTGDWYSKGGYRLELGVRYALRYNFDGSMTASFGRQQFSIGSPYAPDDPPRQDYAFALTHNQQVDPFSRLTADVTYLTNSYYQRFSNDLNQLLNQSVRSAVTYSTSWEGTNRSLTVNLSRQQDLVNGTSSNVLPDVTLNQSQIFPFRSEGSTGNAWYEMIGFNYTGRALNTLDLTRRKEIRAAGDTTDLKETFDRRGLQHTFGLISSPKFGSLTLQPSFSLTERWYDHRTERRFDTLARRVVGSDAHGFYAVHTFSLGLSASTKLYGTVAPNVLGIQGLRHTLQPTIRYSYNPDFSTDAWGYYKNYRDSTGSYVRYDPYSGYAYRPGEVFGGVGSGESQTIGMDLQNYFEMKLNPAEGDSTMTPRKIQLLTLAIGTSYNMVRDSMKLAPLQITYRTNVENLVDISGGATFSPYVFQRRRIATNAGGLPVLIPGNEINRMLVDAGQGLARLTAFDIHLSSTFTQDLFSSKRLDTSRSVAATLAARQGSDAGYDWKIPWSLGIGFDYSLNQFDPDNVSRSSSMRANLSINPTPNWRVTASMYYDFVTRQLGAPQITINRDLHCWEMNFNWVPAGYYRHFEFVIRLKAPQLQDIKLERKGSDRGVY